MPSVTRALIFIFVVSFTGLIQALKCPPFANMKSSCTAATCGHFVYKGSFVRAEAQGYRLSGMENGLSLNPGKGSLSLCCKWCSQVESCAYWSFNSTSGLCLGFGEELCKKTSTSGSVTTVSSNSAVYDADINDTLYDLL